MRRCARERARVESASHVGPFHVELDRLFHVTAQLLGLAHQAVELAVLIEEGHSSAGAGKRVSLAADAPYVRASPPYCQGRPLDKKPLILLAVPRLGIAIPAHTSICHPIPYNWVAILVATSLPYQGIAFQLCPGPSGFPLLSAPAPSGHAPAPPRSVMNSRRCSGRDVRFIARPPHRSVRAAFPHTAPASGV